MTAGPPGAARPGPRRAVGRLRQHQRLEPRMPLGQHAEHVGISRSYQNAAPSRGVSAG